MSQERHHLRSHSRGRFSYPSNPASASSTTSAANRRSDRSSSRASFLGRPRQRTYQVADDAAATRWRSESRTVRGSVDGDAEIHDDDDDDDGFVFTDEDEDGQAKQHEQRTARNKAQPRKGYKSTSISPPPNRDLAPSQQATTPSQASSLPASSSQQSPPAPSSGPTPPVNAPANDLEKQQPQPGQTGDEGQHHHHHHRPPRLSRVPYPIAHFLGYRSEKTKDRALIRPVEKLPRKLETLIWAWIGALIGLGFVMILFSRWDMFSMSSNTPTTSWTAPIIVGSFGASSVILYGTPASPLGQPRSFVLGQFISALVGCCVLKLFELNSNYNPQLINDSHSLVWVAGGISVATALCAMIITDTIHPPGGATALLITTSPPVIRLGWKYLPVILLSSVIMVTWAMLWMNLGRAKYPTFWIEPSNKAVTLASLGIWTRNAPGGGGGGGGGKKDQEKNNKSK
ncbi:uncharacterized protein PFL1_00474 [Pseudozyma flocculosa PF-1]|uniref:HPP transmembrane region domain-containing protein n=1 Tax=Pseudozyma flocculosa TaxID=84751 RepID=A0A5C3ETC7_9BASI|nr:uncharacterized protein PFL1_00474 [Pseudozyma flocculosa PF-1]EPQ32277.1 hypothetical protein PFL1_00474 [Pseudozyma flocculosa PF-1]SPO34767.1 uncharacterized protein PSFLO_00238 [Pseudozyma flocculosa]